MKIGRGFVFVNGHFQTGLPLYFSLKKPTSNFSRKNWIFSSRWV